MGNEENDLKVGGVARTARRLVLDRGTGHTLGPLTLNPGSNPTAITGALPWPLDAR